MLAGLPEAVAMLALLALLPWGEDAAATLADARVLMLKGAYEEALDKYAAAEKTDPAAAAVGRARCHAALGKLDAAEAVLAAAPPASAEVRTERSALRLLRGDGPGAMAEAAAALAADAKSWAARMARARAFLAMGRDAEGEADCKALIDRYNEVQPSDAETLLLVAEAATEYVARHPEQDQYQFILNDLLGEAAKNDPRLWQARWRSGALLLSKYNRTQGIPDLQAALTLNPRAAEVHVELARADLQGYDVPAARVRAAEALEINPNSVEALCVKAEAELFDERTPEATPILEQALKINPNSEPALARLAAARALLGKPYDDLERRAAAASARPAVFHADLGEQLERRRMFALAEKHFRQAIAIAPWFGPPRNGLGMLLMRVGREDDARTEFAAAKKRDPYHQRVANFATVLKHMEKYKVVAGPHYLVYVSPGKDEVLGKYMLAHLEEMHPILCKRFGYEPPEPVKIEVMANHEMFSGRCVGVPSIGTVGACTGKVVALASPSALDMRLNWARVLTHEVTHIITLAQTDFRIPHWYTEALAVLSEESARPEQWNELLRTRVPKGELLNLDTINAAFIRPKTPDDWQMAYCQSLLYAQYMLERFGQESLAKLLAAYAAGLETEPALRRAFGVAKADFETGYLAFVKKTAAGLPTWGAAKPPSYAEAERAVRNKPDDPGAAAQLAEHLRLRKNPERARELAETALKLQPNHPGALCVLAKMELSIGKVDDAIATLKPGIDPKNPDPRAVETLIGLQLRKRQWTPALALIEEARKRDPLRGKWPALAVEALLKQEAATGHTDGAALRAALEQAARIDVDNVSARRKLAELSLKDGRFAEAKIWAKEALHIDTLNATHQGLLGRAKLGLKDFAGAAAEFDEALKDAKAKPGLLVAAAETYLGAGNAAKARQLLRERLAAAPNDDDAKKLLEKAR